MLSEGIHAGKKLFVTFDHIFSVWECETIICLSSGSIEAVDGGVFDDDKGCYRVNHHKRRVTTYPFPRAEATEWIYARLEKHFEAAAQFFEVSIGRMLEDVKLMVYHVGDHFKTWHRDVGQDESVRRISMSVELSDPGAFTGGRLQIYPYGGSDMVRVPRGGGLAFLSTAQHRVSPVRNGTRYSLVNWVAGGAEIRSATPSDMCG